MAEKKKKGQNTYFKVEGGKVIRLRKSCPKCGVGYFLAEHRDRFTCGNCSYTEFKKK